MKKTRFGLKELILSVTLIALGFGIPVSLVCINKSNIRIVRPGPLENYVLLFSFIIWLSAAPLIGAGVLLPFKRPMRGVLVGLWLDVLVIIACVAWALHSWSWGLQ